MAAMGFATHSPTGTKGTLSTTEPVVVVEDEWASTVAKYAMALLSARARGMLWHSQAYPGRFACVLRTNPCHSAALLKQMQEDHVAWTTLASKLGDPSLLKAYTAS